MKNRQLYSSANQPVKVASNVVYFAGAESSGEILAAKGLTRPAPLRAHHKKASGSQPEAAATNVGNGSAKPNPDAALEASEQSEISAPSDPNEEFLAELLGELLGAAPFWRLLNDAPKASPF